MIRKAGLPLLLLACVVAAGCKGSTPAAVLAKPPDVVVAEPVEQMVTDTEEFPGRVDAVNTVQIKARVQGYLTEVHFVDGQEVQADDVLAIIQQDPYEFALRAAKAQVELQDANIGLARVVLKRAENSGAGATSLELDQDRAQVAQAEANLQLAQANLRTAQLNYDWTVVRAPLIGRLSRRLVDPGNVVVSDNSAGANATVLTTLVSLDPVYVYFDIDERTMLRLERLSREKRLPVPWKVTVRARSEKGAVAVVGKREALDGPAAGLVTGGAAPRTPATPDALDARPGVPAAGLVSGGGLPSKLGLPVAIGLSDEDELADPYPHKGVMNFADNVVNRQTGTLRIRGEFDNADRLLTPGMFCRVQVPIGTPHSAILVADKALGTDQGRKYVYVVDDDGVVSQRDVKVGALHDGRRVIEEGLRLHERVVIDGLQRVKPKIKVTATQTDMPREKAATDMQLVNTPPKDNGARASGK
jgi:RND family efflux transporter MFP subunit